MQVRNVNIGDLVKLSTTLPDVGEQNVIRGKMQGFLNEIQNGISQFRMTEMLDALGSHKCLESTIGKASMPGAVRAAILKPQDLANVIGHITRYWDEFSEVVGKPSAEPRKDVSSTMKRNLSKEEQEVWDLINKG